MEIPAHLRQVFRLLESHGGLLKQKFKHAKRSIKFDDEAMSLTMDVKISMDDEWERITESDARISKAEREEHERRNPKKKANPGGKAGRRALLLPSPEIGFRRAPSSERMSGGPSETGSGSWGFGSSDPGSQRPESS